MKPSECKRLVVKVGSALLVDKTQGVLKTEWLQSLCDDLAANGTQILVVSSGAIALGRTRFKNPDKLLTLEQSQAAASLGQSQLIAAWQEALRPYQKDVAQILLTLDTENRRSYLNARATIDTLLAMNAIPVINENDTVTTSEIRYGDNDRLAARVASMVEADGLILLSDIDGMYTANPQLDHTAVFLPVIEQITSEIEAAAGGAVSKTSRGGMKTKVDAAKIAVASGCAMMIATGKIMHPVRAIEQGGKHTLFKAQGTPLQARKKWILGSLDTKGHITIDEGAVSALFNGKSLLPAGALAVSGVFQEGDIVSVLNEKGAEVARGRIAYDSTDTAKILGKKTAEIAAVLGHACREELIHRTHMVLV
jgi:glutamate 5-kinase